MSKSNSQIDNEQRFLIMTVVITILFAVGVVIIALNWNAWFGKDIPPTSGTSKITTTSLADGSAMNGANVETVLIVK